ncbi:MAG: hypothetical protein ACTSVI_05140 [Promethearchaeota archaeon]
MTRYILNGLPCLHLATRLALSIPLALPLHARSFIDISTLETLPEEKLSNS